MFEEALKLINNTHSLGKEVSVIVESIEDEYFWSAIFENFFPSLAFKCYTSYSGKKSGGVHEVLKYQIVASKTFILCIDADYRWLIGDKYLQQPFIFHTYAYSVDNYKIAPGFLMHLIPEFDFLTFFRKYSEIVYPVFIYLLYYEKVKYHQAIRKEKVWKHAILSKSEVSNTLTIPIAEMFPENLTISLNPLQERVNHLYSKLKTELPLFNSDELADELGIKKEKVHWHMKGAIIESVASNLIKRIYEKNKQKIVLKEVYKLYISYLTNDNIFPFICKIKEDIQTYINNC
jgi:hypothetical protein